MSKTKGNVIDPLEAIDEFGADALRFTLASAASSGRPYRSSETASRAPSTFATKIWNAARFTLSQLDAGRGAEIVPGRNLRLPDRWILSRLAATAADVNRHLEEFRFDEASQARSTLLLARAL